MMDGVIDANGQLDYIEFQTFLTQNRYDAFVCYENRIEKVTSGLLEHLLLYLPEVKDLHSKGSNVKYKLNLPENTRDVKWFTKSTLMRFLQIIGSSNIRDITNSVKNEISQLEEARRFHCSLYTKGAGQLQNAESGLRAEDADASKNELLRAIDLRLTALEGKLITAFDQMTGLRLHVQEMTEIEKFSDHVGSTDLRDSLRKYIYLMQKNKIGDDSSSKQLSKERNYQKIESSSLDTPVQYGVSPAKVAQLERQSSTGSDESSLSSEEEQPLVERSRTLIRSASPRRSASPMRRVQIGRSGSRRSTAITIKSLNAFPVRERSFLPQAENDSDEGESVQASKKTESNVNRISVKDAINLFERKQGDQTVDIQKAKSLLTASTGAGKSVLRRWSSGIGEYSPNCSQDVDSKDENPIGENNLGISSNNSPKVELEPSVSPDSHPIQASGSENKASSPLLVHEETHQTEPTSVSEKITDSAEWSRQKEAELNELLMKMMETKPVQSRNLGPDKSKRQSLPAKQRGGLYDSYKEKRDEKLRGETAKKKAEKDKQIKAVQQVPVASKSRMVSASAGDASKKQIANKVKKPQKNISQPANPKTESPKLGLVKKVVTKSSSLPATRKSWPSVPSPRAPGVSPAKTPIPSSSTGTAPIRRKSQPVPPVSRSTAKEDTAEPRKNLAKPNQVDSKKTVRSVTEKKQQPATKPTKMVKNKVQSASEDSVPVAKPSLYSKVTKKSSVVPVESKPFLRKGSKTISSDNQFQKTKVSPSPRDSVKTPENVTPVVENESASSPCEPVIMHQESETKELETHTVAKPETSEEIPLECEAEESFIEVKRMDYDIFDKVYVPDVKDDFEEEESTISPTAWVEIEEPEDEAFASSDHICQTGSPTFVAPVGGSSPRVRHSLSQMLLQESSEPDIIDWGNAENPPTMVYQKDAPKGLKRLLKFARKSKTDSNWSSLPVFSEGEDDTEDLKSVSKRNAENLVKKATFQSMNNGHQKITSETYGKNSSEYDHPAQANMNKINVQSLSQHIQEGLASASPTMSRGTRSFFSLSAFKGNK